MALIRCPECDTGHELDDALLAGAPRRVRCAQCRAVWLAEPEAVTAEIAPSEFPSQDEIDAAFDAPLPGNAASAPAGQDDIDALFDAPAPAAAEAGQNDIDALFDAPLAGTAPTDLPPAATPAPALAAATEIAADADEPKPRRNRPMPAPAARSRAPASASPSFFTVFAAALVGTCLSLLAFRHEIIAITPWASGVYTAVGLGARDSGLVFEDVRSRIVKDDGRETLEVSGIIINSAAARQILPMLRLSVRNEAGAELFVWTATADQADLASKARIAFRRRLASPPAGSHAVEVRFVPPEDVVASIR